MSTMQILTLVFGLIALAGVVFSYIRRNRKLWTFCMSVLIVCVIFGGLSLVLR